MEGATECTVHRCYNFGNMRVVYIRFGKRPLRRGDLPQQSVYLSVCLSTDSSERGFGLSCVWSLRFVPCGAFLSKEGFWGSLGDFYIVVLLFSSSGLL